MVIIRRKFLRQLIHDIDINYLEFVSVVRIYEADLNKWRSFFLNQRKCHTPTVRAKYKCVRCRRVSLPHVCRTLCFLKNTSDCRCDNNIKSFPCHSISNPYSLHQLIKRLLEQVHNNLPTFRQGFRQVIFLISYNRFLCRV